MSDAARLRLFHRLQAAAHRLKTRADTRLAAAAGVTTAQCALLAVLDEDGPSPQRAVARRLGFNESAMTPMVRRLLDAGLAARAPAEHDRRVRVLTLTNAGRAALEAAREPFTAVNADIDAALGGLDAHALARALDAMGRGS